MSLASLEVGTMYLDASSCEQLRLMFPDQIVPEELHTMLARLDPALAGVRLLALCESELDVVRIKLACARLGLLYGTGADVLIRVRETEQIALAA